MFYKFKNALELFFYHFLTNTIRCAGSSTFDDIKHIENEIKKLEEDMKDNSSPTKSSVEKSKSSIEKSKSSRESQGYKSSKNSKKNLKTLKERYNDLTVLIKFQEFYLKLRNKLNDDNRIYDIL